MMQFRIEEEGNMTSAPSRRKEREEKKEIIRDSGGVCDGTVGKQNDNRSMDVKEEQIRGGRESQR